MSAAIVANLNLGGTEQSYGRDLVIFENGTIHLTVWNGESTATVKFNRAEALALAEAITQNVKEPAHV